MPVDVCVVMLPVMILVATGLGVLGGRMRIVSRWLTGFLVCLFLLIYVVPGWVLWSFAVSGHRDSQYQLGNYYWARWGYNWPNLEARDHWWLMAARQGHPRAMSNVGACLMRGSSRTLPRDLDSARTWLEQARSAGDPDAPGLLLELERVSEPSTAQDAPDEPDTQQAGEEENRCGEPDRLHRGATQN